MNPPTPTINIGIAGLGAAGRAFLPAIAAHAGFKLVAVADPLATARDEVSRTHDAAAYSSVAALLAHPKLDAVYIATPTDVHEQHVLAAFAAGKHVLVEKPMAATLDGAKAMVLAGERAERTLLVGHSHSFDAPIKAMHELIEGGSLGRVQMVNTWCFTDWLYRPRRADELDNNLGGGVTFRQGAHQFDIIRLLCGGMARRVRARTFDWDPARRATGAHIAYIDFVDGAAATAVYNGYGRFSSMDLGFNISEWGFLQPPENRPPLRRAANASAEAEQRAKQQRPAMPASARYQPFFGLTLVSCERGEIRQSPEGLLVATAEGQSEIKLPTDRSPRDIVMAEFYDAITGHGAAIHDGRWGLANLEVCAAVLLSSHTGREIVLQEQVAVNGPLSQSSPQTPRQ